jgi:hypothetical protein
MESDAIVENPDKKPPAVGGKSPPEVSIARSTKLFTGSRGLIGV